MKLFSIKIKTSIVSAFFIVVSAIIISVMFIQYKSSQEFALLTTQEVFKNITKDIVNQKKQYDISSDNFITLLKNLEITSLAPEKNQYHPLLKIITEYIKNANQTYSVYIGYGNDQFYQVINLNVSNNVKDVLHVPEQSRWLIVKHFINNNQIIRVEKSLNEQLRVIKTTEKTTQYRPTKRPWYIKALQKDETVKTDPYIFSSLQKPGVTYARKISPNSNIVIGLDISLASLSKVLSSPALVQGSGAYIFKFDGTVVGQYDTHLTKKITNLDEKYKNIFIENGNIKDINKQIVVNITGKQYIKSTQKLTSKYGVDENIVIFSPLDVVMQPYKEKIYTILKYMLGAILLLILPFVYLIVRLIVSPIVKLEKENQKIQSGEFDKVQKVNSYMVEINSLSSSLLSMSKSIEQNQKTLELKVQERTKDIENLLNNAGQGFLSFDEDMIIKEKSSLEAQQIFGQDISGLNITKLLHEDDEDKQNFVTLTLQSILKDEPMKQEILLSLLDKEFMINGKNIEVAYKILDSNSYMLILTDITKQKELAKKIEKEQQILKMVVETVTTLEQFIEVKNDYEEFVKNIESFDSVEVLQTLRNSIHTFKGLFAQKEMYNIVQHLHEFESAIDISIKQQEVVEEVSCMTKETMLHWLEEDIDILESILGDDFFENKNSMSIDISRISTIITKIENYIEENKKFKEIYNDVETLTHEHIQVFVNPYKKLIEQLSQRLDKYIEPLDFDYENIYENEECKPFTSKTKAILEKIERFTSQNEQFQMVSHELEKLKYHHVKIFLEPYKKLVEQLSQRLEKSIEPLKLEYSDIYISERYKPFLNSLVHVFRNSVDHGIESVDERYELEKSEYGIISCKLEQKNETLIVSIGDDGRGINIEKIKNKAFEKGLYPQSKLDTLDDEAVIMILFDEGFSTTTEITNISGRGVGLASTLSELKKLNGTIKIVNTPQKGLKFIFTIPYKG